MSEFKIATGIQRANGTVDPALGESITRAQVMAIIVRAFGAEKTANDRKGTMPFPDVSTSHWASGYVTVAKEMAAANQVSLGRSNGMFDPEAQVTLAEVLAFVMKFLGAPRDTTVQWPNDYINGAVKGGLISESDRNNLLDLPSVPASRGMAFALADTIFYNYKGLPGGKSVYTTYVDPTGPAVTFDSIPTATEEDSLTIRGRVDLDTVSLIMGSQQLRFGTDGTFSATVPLVMGGNAFAFEAVDRAGNKTSSSLTITRNEPAPKGPKIAALNPSTTVASVLERVTFSPVDEDGKPITEGVVYTTDNEDFVILRNGAFQAVMPGRYFVKGTVGKLFATTVIEVYGAAEKLQIDAPSIVANGTASKTVTVTAVDAIGTPVLNFGQNSERIRLSGTGITAYDENGVEVTELAAKNGKATFKVKVASYMAGERVTLTARHEGTKILTGSTTLEALNPVGSGLKVEGPTFLSANRGTTFPNAVKVWVVDQDGAPVRYSYSVAASITGPADLINASAVYSNETSPATFDLNNWNTVGIVGPITLTFSVEGVGSKVFTIQHTIAGSPASLAVKPDKSTRPATETFTVTVDVSDRNGVPVTYNEVSDTTLTVSLPTDLQNKFVLSNTNPVIPRGRTSATFTLAPREKFTGDLLVTVTGPNGITGNATLTIVPGPVSTRSFDRQKAIVPVSAPRATFNGYVADMYGNPIVQRDVAMKAYVQEVYSTSSLNGTNTTLARINGQTTTYSAPLTVQTDADGKVKLDVEATPYPNKIYMIVLTNATGGDPAYAYLSVNTTTPAGLEVSTFKYIAQEGGRYFPSANITAGDTFYVRARVKDMFGGPVTNIGNELRITSGKVFSLDGTTLAESSTFSFQPHTNFSIKMIEEMGLQEGDYLATVVGGLAGNQTITVEYNMTVDKVVGTKTITVNPGEFTKVVMNDGNTIKVKVGSVTGPYLLKLADRFGNLTTTTTRQEIILQPTLNGTPTTALGFRTELAGANLSKVEINAMTSLYMDVNTVGNFTINLYGGITPNSVQVEVSSN